MSYRKENLLFLGSLLMSFMFLLSKSFPIIL